MAASTMSGNVYVAWLEGTRLLKIGFSSSSSSRRIKSWSTGSPGEVVFLKEMPGGRTLERELHRRYADSRVEASGREWFEANERMVEQLGLPRCILEAS